MHVDKFDSIDIRMRVLEVQEKRDEIHSEDRGLNVEVHLVAPEREIIEELPFVEEKDVDKRSKHEVKQNMVEDKLR